MATPASSFVPGELLHGREQIRVTLPHDAVQLARSHAGVLHLFKGLAGVDALVLAGVPDHQDAVLRSDFVEEVAHLPGAGQARLIQQIEMLTGGISCRAIAATAGKEALQGSGADPCLAQLIRSFGRGSKAFDCVAALLSAPSRTVESAVVFPVPAKPCRPCTRSRDVSNSSMAVRWPSFRMRPTCRMAGSGFELVIIGVDGSPDRCGGCSTAERSIAMVSGVVNWRPVACLEAATWKGTRQRLRADRKLCRILRIGEVAHAAAQCIPHEETFVGNSFPFEASILGVGDCLLGTAGGIRNALDPL